MVDLLARHAGRTTASLRNKLCHRAAGGELTHIKISRSRSAGWFETKAAEHRPRTAAGNRSHTNAFGMRSRSMRAIGRFPGLDAAARRRGYGVASAVDAFSGCAGQDSGDAPVAGQIRENIEYSSS